MIFVECENADGFALRFGNSFETSPFILEDATGILEGAGDVLTSESAMLDGATWQNTHLKKREIVLTLRDKPGQDAEHAENRRALYRLFPFKRQGTLRVIVPGAETEEGGESAVASAEATETDINAVTREIGMTVESIKVSQKNRSHTYTVTLICPDPFFKEAVASDVETGTAEAHFELPTEFFAGEYFEMGEIGSGQIVTIENDGAGECGLVITLSANGAVVNPVVTHIGRQESIQIGTTRNPFTLRSGQAIRISTLRGQKSVTLLSGGAEESLMARLSSSSEFIQLALGENELAIGAASGKSALSARFEWQILYAGM